MDAPQSTMGGTGTVGRNADGDVKADEAVLRCTMTITRAATGKVETYQFFGTAIKDEEK